MIKLLLYCLLIKISLFPIFCEATSLNCRKLSNQEIEHHFVAYKNIATLNADFIQTKIIEKLAVKIMSTGKMKLVRPAQIYWDVLTPSPLSFSLNGSTMKVVTKKFNGESSTFKQNISEKSNGIHRGISRLIELVDMNIKTIIKNYEICIWKKVFTLTPKDEKKSIFKEIKIKFNKSGIAKEIRIKEKSGDTIDIALTNIKTTQ